MRDVGTDLVFKTLSRKGVLAEKRRQSEDTLRECARLLWEEIDAQDLWLEGHKHMCVVMVGIDDPGLSMIMNLVYKC